MAEGEGRESGGRGWQRERARAGLSEDSVFVGGESQTAGAEEQRTLVQPCEETWLGGGGCSNLDD